MNIVGGWCETICIGGCWSVHGDAYEHAWELLHAGMWLRVACEGGWNNGVCGM